jgi:NAD(P)-dependent dehydrogenase (short-subunit alcohol dehydrogenase family)
MERKMGKLDGKTALITGGNSGIGLATAKRFVNVGAYVFITGRRAAELTAGAWEIEKNVTGVQGNVSNLGELDRPFAQIKREKGKLDIVFANAGVATYAPFGIVCGRRVRAGVRRRECRELTSCLAQEHQVDETG